MRITAADLQDLDGDTEIEELNRELTALSLDSFNESVVDSCNFHTFECLDPNATQMIPTLTPFVGEYEPCSGDPRPFQLDACASDLRAGNGRCESDLNKPECGMYLACLDSSI